MSQDLIFGLGPDGKTAIALKVAADGTLATSGGGGGGGGTADSTAANQATQIGHEAAIRTASEATSTAIGSQADAVATDDIGSASLIARVKRLTQRISTMIGQIPPSRGALVASQSMSVTQDTDSTWRTRAYQPTLGTGGALALTAATTSAAQAVTAGTVIRYGNSTSAPIIIEFGTSSGVVATANGAIEIMPGTSEAIMVPSGATYFAAYCAQAATLKWIVGTGS